MSNIYQHIGEKIKEARLDYRRIVGDHKRKLMTQSELAQYCGVTFQQIQKYEKGTNKVPLDKLLMIAERTRKNLLWFLPVDNRERVVMNTEFMGTSTQTESQSPPFCVIM